MHNKTTWNKENAEKLTKLSLTTNEVVQTRTNWYRPAHNNKAYFTNKNAMELMQY